MTTITNKPKRIWPDDQKQITLWLPIDLLDPVAELTWRKRVSRAELIRQLLAAAVEAEGLTFERKDRGPRV